MTQARPSPDLVFPDGELARWLCLGAVGEDRVRAWLRAPEAPNGAVEAVLTGPDGRTARATARCVAEHDWIAAIDLRLDEAAPRAAFTVSAAGLDRVGRFAEAPGEPASFRFGFGSCHQPFRASTDGVLERHGGAGLYGPMREELRRRNAAFLLLLGDQVYSDGTDGVDLGEWMTATPSGERSDEALIAAYRHLYRGYFNESGFRGLLESLPSYLIWDDHDISDSWGSRLRESEDDRRLFRAARHTYREYQHLHNPGTSLDDEGAHDYHFIRGDVGFLVLDLRNDRDWSAGVVLGDEQWERTDAFLERAAEQQIETLFVVASIPLIHFPPHAVRLLQWVPGGKGSDVRDRWDATPFRSQRDALIERLGRWQQGGAHRQVIVLSGDVHAGAAFRVRDRETGGVFQQWTSSSLSAPGGLAHDFVNWAGPRIVNWGERRCRAKRVGFDSRNNFGVVELTALPGGGHEVSFDLMVRTRRGATRRAFRAVARPEN